MGAKEQGVGEEYLSYSSFVILPRSDGFANAFIFLIREDLICPETLSLKIPVLLKISFIHGSMSISVSICSVPLLCQERR